MEVKCLHIHLERLRVRGFEREMDKCGTTSLERERDTYKWILGFKSFEREIYIQIEIGF